MITNYQTKVKRSWGTYQVSHVLAFKSERDFVEAKKDAIKAGVKKEVLIADLKSMYKEAKKALEKAEKG